jgi:phage-related protein
LKPWGGVTWLVWHTVIGIIRDASLATGGRPPSAKAWHGLGPGVLEIVEHDAAGTYRAVYTVRFVRAIYVLHVFQKKSPSGIRTSRTDVRLIEERLKLARQDYEVRYGEEK